MRPFLPIAKLFGLGTLELIVILIILLVLFSPIYTSVGGKHSYPDSEFSRRERQIMIGLGAVLVALIGVLMWRRISG